MRGPDEKWSPDEKGAWQKVVAIVNGYPGMKEVSSNGK
jgi:hypothetical protein